MKTIEYRVRPVKRYIVSRWHNEDLGNGTVSGGSMSYGEFENAYSANDVCKALAAREPEAKCTLISVHASDCAVHNAPAFEAGQCDCGQVDSM